MTRKPKKKNIDPAQLESAEREIREYSKNVKFTVTEYTFEFIVQKLRDNRYYVPEYQRNLIWKPKSQSKFIESVLIGLPIPFAFFWQAEDGRMEIVDGSQRLRTIRDFMENKFALQGLELLPSANGLKFQNLNSTRQLVFAESSIRVIILDNSTDAITRTEMFTRINTGGTTANEAEVRRGSLPGPFMDLIISLGKSPELVEATPINSALVKQREREELVTRFFAYLERYVVADDREEDDMLGYKDEPRKFYFSFVKETNERISSEIAQTGESQKLEEMKSEFRKMLEFVKKISPNGFTKTSTGSQVPRVRFEAIAVGAALALRADPKLFDKAPDITELIESDPFKEVTKSDAANVKGKLLGRIRLVRDWLVTR